ncbi:MAG: LOG family protein [Acidimicrobiia bacterium]
MKESDRISIDPFRSMLYTNGDLLAGFDPSDPLSYASTYDFRVYREWVSTGGEHASHIHAVARAIHDSSISDALDEFVTGRPVVGIMGGHQMTRSSRADSPYRRVVRLARDLAAAGYLVLSGGGPGAMEATHFGARTSGMSESDVGRCLVRLEDSVGFPEGLGRMVRRDGTIDEALLRRLHAWQSPAFEMLEATEPATASLAVPTWHYGHEPPTPFATHIAKYFQNSVREDGLLAVAAAGLVFFEGRAGTIQEVFQDAAQNYYGRSGVISPMVFIGVELWTHAYPVWGVLQKLFGEEQMLCLTDSIEEAADFIASHPPRRY